MTRSRVFSDRRIFSGAIIFLLGTCLFLTGCGGANPSPSGSNAVSPSPESGGISGTIYATSTSPLGGAYVETLEKQTTTSASGVYLLYPLEAGNYRVTARYSGYTPGVRDNVRVQAGLITENIDVNLSPVRSASAASDFEVLSVNPFYGTDGDEIYVLVKGLDSTRGRVTINGKDASIMDWNSKNDGSIRIRLPEEVESGDVKVIINGESSHETTPVRFIGRPVALEARPSFAKPGEKVALPGRNYYPIISFNKVLLNDLPCVVLPDSNIKQLNILIPDNAEPGPFKVKVVGDAFELEGISYAALNLPPELVFLSPQRSLPGVTLTLYGKHFGDDKNAVRIFLGEKKVLVGNDILKFSSKKLTFVSPDTALVPVGKSIEISVGVNSNRTASFTWGSFDPALANISNYGIYDFSVIAPGKTLRLARLSPDDQIAFLSTLSDTGINQLDGRFGYNVTSLLGSNAISVPNSINTAARQPQLNNSRAESSVYRNGGARTRNRDNSRARGIFALAEPAPATTSFWVVNLASVAPQNPDNDVAASATLQATGTYCFIYVDPQANPAVTASDSEKIAAEFDELYAKLRPPFQVMTPPEGDIDPPQSRVVIFVTPKINSGVSGNLQTIGYFNPRDKNPIASHSAGTEILYMYNQAYIDSPDEFRGAMAHELQRMMYFNQKASETVPWLEAGLSMFARDVASAGFNQGVKIPRDRVAAYLRQPQKISLNHWPAIQSDVSPENFGMPYLFVQYLFERCSGNNAMRALQTYRSGTGKGFPDITTNVLPAPNGPGIGLIDFFNQFALAMYCDDMKSTLIPSTYQFQNISLRTGASGVGGLHHLVWDENPYQKISLLIPGYGCDVVEYIGGNDGDLEFTINSTPTVGTFKTWVIYLPNK